MVALSQGADPSRACPPTLQRSLITQSTTGTSSYLQRTGLCLRQTISYSLPTVKYSYVFLHDLAKGQKI